jgi:chromosome segregation ATPase
MGLPLIHQTEHEIYEFRSQIVELRRQIEVLSKEADQINANLQSPSVKVDFMALVARKGELESLLSAHLSEITRLEGEIRLADTRLKLLQEEAETLNKVQVQSEHKLQENGPIAREIRYAEAQVQAAHQKREAARNELSRAQNRLRELTGISN